MDAKYSILVIVIVAALLMITSIWFTPAVADILI